MQAQNRTHLEDKNAAHHLPGGYVSHGIYSSAIYLYPAFPQTPPHGLVLAIC